VFVDSHTQSGVLRLSRWKNFPVRLRGDSYMENHGSVAAHYQTQSRPHTEATKAELLISAKKRLDSMLFFRCDDRRRPKAAYGLDDETEIKQLEVMTAIESRATRVDGGQHLFRTHAVFQRDIKARRRRVY
jgi:hypothetical protein